MAIDRKILAIETESGVLFSIAYQRGLPALTVRGISDYAGTNKTLFEEETRNNARKIAVENAASFLVRQLGATRMLAYFNTLRRRSNELSQLPLVQMESGDNAYEVLVKQSDAFTNKLRDLAPGYSLHSKGYRLPIPRIRTIDTRMVDPKAEDRTPIEVREALRDSRIITLHVPKEYPDLSLSWIIANDLLSAEIADKKLVPWVIEGSALQRPRTGIAQLLGPEVRRLTETAIVQHVFIIDDFKFESTSRMAYLKEQIDAWPDAKFIIVTRSRTNVILESEFTKNVASSTAEDFARKYDFKISPARFVSLFIEKGILHVEDDCIRFTMPFMESYLLAKRLTEGSTKAVKYFAIGSTGFDFRSFALYAEMGAATELVNEVNQKLDSCIERMLLDGNSTSVLLGNSLMPAMLRRQDRLKSIQERLRKAEEEVRTDRDQSREKQRLLDANDRIREEAVARLAQTEQAESDPRITLLRDAAAVWTVAVSLLGAGAERLEAQTKREIAGKIIKLSVYIIDKWTMAYKSVDFEEIKKKVVEAGLAKKITKTQSEEGLKEAARTIEYIVDFVEFVFLLQPVLSIVSHLCEEARDKVLAESITNTFVGETIDDLLRNVWLSDIDVAKGSKGLVHAIKALPSAMFLRFAIASHLIARVYWRHWRKEDRLLLLDAASESLKGAGVQYNKSELKRIIEKLPDTDDADL